VIRIPVRPLVRGRLGIDFAVLHVMPAESSSMQHAWPLISLYLYRQRQLRLAGACESSLAIQKSPISAGRLAHRAWGVAPLKLESC